MTNEFSFSREGASITLEALNLLDKRITGQMGRLKYGNTEAFAELSEKRSEVRYIADGIKYMLEEGWKGEM